MQLRRPHPLPLPSKLERGEGLPAAVPLSTAVGRGRGGAPHVWPLVVSTIAVLALLAGGAVAIARGQRQPPPHLRQLPPDTGLAQVLASHTLRVAVDASYPPFEVAAADGTVHGFDVDLAKRLADALGVHVAFLNLPQEQQPDALVAGKADVIISSLHPDRRLELAFSQPYYNAGQVLVVPRDDQTVTGLPSLLGKAVGVELGSDADELLRQGRPRAISVRRFDSIGAAMQAMAQGTVAAVVTDAPTAADFQRRGTAIRVAGAPLSDEPYVVAAAPQNRSLIRAINGALDDLQQSGTLQALLAQDL